MRDSYTLNFLVQYSKSLRLSRNNTLVSYGKVLFKIVLEKCAFWKVNIILELIRHISTLLRQNIDNQIPFVYGIRYTKKLAATTAATIIIVIIIPFLVALFLFPGRSLFCDKDY